MRVQPEEATPDRAAPMVLDALDFAGVSLADFMADFELQTRENGRWSTARSPLFDVQMHLITSREGAVITASSTLRPGVHLNQNGRLGLLRLPWSIFETDVSALPESGRSMGMYFDNPLLRRPNYEIRSVKNASGRQGCIVTFAAEAVSI